METRRSFVFFVSLTLVTLSVLTAFLRMFSSETLCETRITRGRRCNCIREDPAGTSRRFFLFFFSCLRLHTHTTECLYRTLLPCVSPNACFTTTSSLLRFVLHGIRLLDSILSSLESEILPICALTTQQQHENDTQTHTDTSSQTHSHRSTTQIITVMKQITGKNEYELSYCFMATRNQLQATLIEAGERKKTPSSGSKIYYIPRKKNLNDGVKTNKKQEMETKKSCKKQ